MRHIPRFLAVVFFLTIGLPDAPARAQEGPPAAPAAEPAPPPDPSKPMGPPDPLNRGTPRGSMYGFLSAARDNDYERAAQFLDLRSLSEAERALGPEYARRLKVVLDQTLWVDVINLSDENRGTKGDSLPAWQDRVGEIATEDGAITVLLQRVPREGDGVRIWKVASDTVVQVPALYAAFEPVWIEEHLHPFFFEHAFFGAALWKWFVLLLLAAAAAGVALVVAGTLTRVLGQTLIRHEDGMDDRIVDLVRGPVALALAVVLFSIGQRYVGLSLEFIGTLRFLERLLLVLAGAWLAFRLIDLAALSLRVRAERRQNRGVLPVLVPGARFAKILILTIGALGVLGTMGVNISAAVAGLGVGGIAVALAAQRSLENLFGGITLFADRPVKVGDFCSYDGQIGTVEEIGLRSTRIRTLERTVVSIPNAEFSNLRLENYADRDRMRLWTILGVRYETTPDQLRFLLARLREILVGHPRITDDPARVRFVGFGSSSLDIEVFAYADTRDWTEFLAIREDVYLRFMDAVAEAGTGFAFPSTTTYLSRDDGLPAEAARRAEGQVAVWREQGALPFPNADEAARQEARNRLDWPPQGSAGSIPTTG